MSELLTQTRMDPAQPGASVPGYLELALERVRLLLRREALRLRGTWRVDPLRDFQGLVVSDEEADRLLGLAPPGQDGADGSEEAALGTALADLDERLASWRPALEAGPDKLYTLAGALGLTPFERDVLVLCLARELNPQIERLFAYLQDDAAARYPTPYLAARLFAPARYGWRSAFTPTAPLRRLHLVRLEEGPHPGSPIAGRPVALDDAVADHLLGMAHTPGQWHAFLRPIEPLPLPSGHDDVVEAATRRLRDAISSGAAFAMNLVGPPGTGKEAVAAAVFIRAGLQPFRLDPARLPPTLPERAETLGMLGRDALLLGLGVYVSGSESSEQTGGSQSGAADLARDLPAQVIVGTTEPLGGDAGSETVRLAKPGPRHQRDLWEQALGPDIDPDGTAVGALVQQFDLGPTEIAGAVRQARARASHRPGTPRVARRDVWDACREATSDLPDPLLQRLVPCFGWEDIVLPEDVHRHLKEISAQVRHRWQVYEDWEFGDKLPRGQGISALFAGPSGTGKTMAAEVLANDLDLDLFVIDLAGVVSKYIGETEKNLRRVFDAAQRSGAILFFDEADALFGKRTEVRDSHDRYANIEVDYLLQRMESYRGLAILATNMKGLLDHAFLRRLRFVVDFPFPGAEERRRIWEKVFPPQAPTDGLDLLALARLEIPGGNIRNIALSAAFLAAGQGAVIAMDHVMHAARREYRKIDKLMLESEFGPWHAGVAG